MKLLIKRWFWVRDCNENPFERLISKDWNEKPGGDSQTPRVL